MPTISSQVSINRPVDHVFNYVVSVDNHPAWQASILEARLNPAGPVALGSVYEYTTDVMGRKIQSALRVSAFEPNETWGVTTTGVPNPVETVYSFAADGANTRLTITMELTGGYPAVAEAAIKQQMQKSLDEQCARIKQFAEG